MSHNDLFTIMFVSCIVFSVSVSVILIFDFSRIKNTATCYLSLLSLCALAVGALLEFVMAFITVGGL